MRLCGLTPQIENGKEKKNPFLGDWTDLLGKKNYLFLKALC